MTDCPHCRAPIRSDLRFCTGCGGRVEPEENSGSAPPATWLDPEVTTSAARRRTLTIGGLAAGALLSILVILWFLLPSGSHHPGPGSLGAGSSAASSVDAAPTTSGEEPGQLAGIDQLLDSSGPTRSDVGSSVQAIDDCGDLLSAENNLNADAVARDQMVSELGALDVDDVPGGQALASDLSAAWSASASSDRSYAQWAANVIAAGTCSTEGNAPHDGDWATAQQTDGSAQDYKSSFVDAWNPLAEQFSLAIRSPDQL